MKTIEYEDGVLKYRQGSGRTIEIYDIVVHHQRRRGTGRRLVNYLLDLVTNGLEDATLVWAITRSTNFIAQEFYEAMGFRVVAVLRNFYNDELKDTTDAIMYGRSVQGFSPEKIHPCRSQP